jgi:hypothetical protein
MNQGTISLHSGLEDSLPLERGCVIWLIVSLSLSAQRRPRAGRHAKRMGGVRPRRGAERYLTQRVTGGSRNDNGHPMTAPQWSGGSRPKPAFTPAALQASLETRQTRADERAASLAPFISELRAAGVTTLKGIAAALNKRGVRTPLGYGRWRAMQVSRLLKRLPR